MKLRKQSTTTYPILFFMVDSADHLTGKTGLSPTVTISKNGGTFGAAAGVVAEVGSGWYKLAGNATDRNTIGALVIHATASGADPLDIDYFIVAYDPFTVVGSSTYTDIIQDGGGIALDEVQVECYSDSGYSSFVTKEETDVTGAFTFHLDPGTYYFRAIKTGYTFTDWSAVVT